MDQTRNARTGMRECLLLALLACGAVLLHGYHYGVQDQFVYLSAIKYQLDPALYSHDSQFFLEQTQWTLFDKLLAYSARATHLRVDWAVFLWHVSSIFLLLLGCLRVSQRCFAERRAQWAAVATVAVMLLLNAAATLLALADEYLHPRTLATALLLFAWSDVLERRARAAMWVVLAGLIHPTLTACGALHLLFQAWKPPRGRLVPLAVALLIPLSLAMISEPYNEAWREVLSSRWFLFPAQWPWYAWFGVVVPLGLLGWYARLGRRGGVAMLEHVSERLLWSGVLGVVIGVLVSILPGLERAVIAEPMRTLHLINLIAVLLGGGLMGQYVLRAKPLRWVVFLLPLCAVMFFAQRQLYRSSVHIEWPGRDTQNAWVHSFEWVRKNTPQNALFALDPRHMSQRGEDWHSFRALAERSMMADYDKDRSVAATGPDLSYAWRKQVRARENWRQFKRDDFLRLRRDYGVTWVIVEQPGVPGLQCPYANDAVKVCRVE